MKVTEYIMKKTLLAIGLTALSIFSINTANAYTLDKVNHVVTVSPSANANVDLLNALNYLATRSDKTTKYTLKVNGGNYSISKGLYVNNLENVDILSDTSNRATLRKAPTSSEYILNLKYAKNVKIYGFNFIGKTDYTSSNSCV